MSSKNEELQMLSSEMVWPFPPGSTALFGFAVDSEGRLLALLLSSERLALCLRRITSAHVADVEVGYAELLATEDWVSLMRNMDEFFGIVGPDGPVKATPLLPESQEAIHIAVETALALWPEWGSRLRGQFVPRAPLFLQSAPDEC